MNVLATAKDRNSVSPPSERSERWGESGEAGRGALMFSTLPEPPPALQATSPNVASLLGEDT